ncbi:MAG: hypothetical protein FJY29_04770 [Betaproteobacteria bacterium]|nr:hypothetical protein [Betaproteobacteria bacterium]
MRVSLLGRGAFLLMLAACSGTQYNGSQNALSTTNSSGSPSAPPGSPQSGNQGGYGVIPPVPVMGSYLTGILTDHEGAPVADAGFKILQTGHAGKTSSDGQFQIPVQSVPSGQVTFEIARPAKSKIELETSLPPELRALVESAKNAPTQRLQLDRRLALAIPAVSFPPQTGSGDGTSPGGATYVPRIQVSANALPMATGGKAYSSFLSVYDESSLNSARYGWVQKNAPLGVVRIAFANSGDTLAKWNGSIDEGFRAAGGQFITNFAACTDKQYTEASGEFGAAAAGQCGMTMLEPPLSRTEPNYFRISVETPTEIKLSIIFQAKFMYQ